MSSSKVVDVAGGPLTFYNSTLISFFWPTTSRKGLRLCLLNQLSSREESTKLRIKAKQGVDGSSVSRMKFRMKVRQNKKYPARSTDSARDAWWKLVDACVQQDQGLVG